MRENPRQGLSQNRIQAGAGCLDNPDRFRDRLRCNELFDKWREQEDESVEGNEESEHRINLSKTMLYVDAGFTDPVYLDEVLKDWLAQDAQNAEKQSDNPERVETRRQITEAVKRIRNLLAEQVQ